MILRHIGMGSTNMKTETAEYYHLDSDDGLAMNLGVNPLLQFGVDETRRQLCENILNDVAVINYVPLDSDTIGNLALDLGGVLQFSGGQADAGKLSAITSMQIKIGGKHTLKDVGKKPRLVRTKGKNISGLLNQIEENKAAGRIGIHMFTNAGSFHVEETDVKMISVEFATSEDVDGVILWLSYCGCECGTVCTGGTAEIGTGDCLAIIMGQSMGVGEAWDGEIRIEEYTKKPDVADRISYEVDETVKRSYGDTFTHGFEIDAFSMPVETED